jgi:P4 family phage/plasmid primase-like protien
MNPQHIDQRDAILEAARSYRESGFALVPTKGKDGFLDGWEKYGIPPEDDAKYWGNGRAYNVGVVLGSASGGLVDIDRDEPSDGLRKIDQMFLPTTLSSGREKRPNSHHWFYCEGLKSRDLRDAAGRKFLEVRGDGRLTVVWPSFHPDDGDRYRWHGKLSQIATTTPEELNRAVNEWATALLLALHMPPVGSRHDYALAAAGYLLRPGRLEAETVEHILLGAWHAASADGHQKTVREVQDAVLDTAERLGSGEEVKGGGVLGELVDGLPKRIARMWGWGRTEATPQPEPSPEPPTKGKPTDDELRDRWLGQYPGYAFGLEEWRRYEGGIWPVVKAPLVKRSIMGVIEGAKPEGIKPSVFVLNSVHELARIELYVQDVVWDGNPNILVAENGAVDLTTGELLGHSSEHYATTRVPYAFDPNAEAARWGYFLSSTLEKEVASFLQEFAGYCLTTDTAHEKAVWLVGQPGGGKSTFLEGLTATLGVRAGVLGLAELERSRFSLAKLEGKTLVTATEQPGGYLSSHHILNAIISGEPVQVEQKYRNPYDLTPRAKIAWALNELPRIPAGAEGLFRRVEVIRFPEIAEKDRDPTLKEDIKGEGAGILNWALEGLIRLRKRGRFEVPPTVEDATDQFRESNDIPKMFVEDRCIEDKDREIRSSELYGAYKDWCDRTGHSPKAESRIAEDWRRLGFEYKKKKTGRFWRGVDLKEHDAWRGRA